jgi:peptidoglycan/LPS O-acetylase OafA/YrhL
VIWASALVNGLVSGAGLWANLHMLTAWALGYGFFLVALYWRGVPAMRAPVAQYLGRISYSLYLLHPLALLLIPATPWAPLTAAIWLVAALGLAAICFRWVERPTMALGARLARAIGPARAGALGQPAGD